MTNSHTIKIGNPSHTDQALRGFHMTIPAGHFSQLTTLPTNPLKLHRRSTSHGDETRLQYLVQVFIRLSMHSLEQLDIGLSDDVVWLVHKDEGDCKKILSNMGHGGYGKRRAAAAERKKPAGQRRPKALTIDKKSKANKPKSVSLKNQIRSIERMLRKDLPHEVKEAQEKKLDELKKQQEIHNRLALERKIFLRNRKIKFFERRKVERSIRRLEKQQRASTGQAQEAEIAEQLTKLKEDLEYVRVCFEIYFDCLNSSVCYQQFVLPQNEKYVSLFMGGDEAEIVEKRNNLRKQIKANLIAAAASGKDLEETGSEDDGLLDPSEDDFFLNGSSSDDADADDEWSARDQASSASGKAASGCPAMKEIRLENQLSICLCKLMSKADVFSPANVLLIQRQISARALMPPPGPSGKPFSSSAKNKSRFAGSSSKKPYNRAEISTSSNTSSSIGRSSFRKRGPMDSTTGNSGNLSSNSDARKPRRKRRPKKKKQQ
ncbi:hypothetical protein Sango_2431100 [Sesamum angolense]|uniref:rRNA-processing protein EFG1 n=1 Tax=Sesamum angolense TaxID=2727404 RepID=A0AAE1W7L2_9LAMI|nr:hypothetical protein Sango_2431100 [Sesamum angolense]